MLIGGLGAGFVVSHANAQQNRAEQTEVVNKPPSERSKADRVAYRQYRRSLFGLDGSGDFRKSFRYGPLSKSESVAATLVFEDLNPAFSSIDVGFISRPEFADIDGDSDLDVFLADYATGDVVYYENVSAGSQPELTAPVLNPFGISVVGNTYVALAFVDIDDDADLDLFVGRYDAPEILFCENTDDLGAPGFLACVNNTMGLSASAVYPIPAFADIDDDGDYDAFVGDGYYDQLVYYENEGDPTNPAFASPQTNPFGLTSVPYYASATFADIDGDGDLDALVGGGVFGGTDDGNSYYYENTGTSPTDPAFAPPLTNPFGIVNVGDYAYPSFADVDGDGDFDILMGDEKGLALLFENEDPTTGHTAPTFTPHPLAPFGLAGVDARSIPTFADLDYDSDIDALVGSATGELLYYENTGDPTSPTFASALTNPFGLTDVGLGTAPTFADIDGDCDEDVFVGESANVYYFENTGGTTGPAFASNVSNPFGLQGLTSASVPTFVDIDGDLDLDYFLGGGTSSTAGVRYQENTGDPWNPAFSSQVANPFGLSGLPDNATPRFADVDGDGDYDLLTGSDNADLIYFENTGSPFAPAFASGITNPSELRPMGPFSATAFADLDDDAKPDLFVGVRGGGIAHFRNLTEPDPATGIFVAPTVFLQGPYLTPSDSMDTGINGEIPMSQPYSDAAFAGTPLEYNGSESLAGSPPLTVVDWVLVQLRTGAPEAAVPGSAAKMLAQTVAGTRAALLLSNGIVLDLDASSPVSFGDLEAGDYYVVVFHRNHLGVMSASPVQLSGGNTGYNFMCHSSQAYGAAPMKLLEPGVWGLFSADAGTDGQVTAGDFNAWLSATKAGLTGYLLSDFNLDGQVTAGDFNQWLSNTKAAALSKVPPIDP